MHRVTSPVLSSSSSVDELHNAEHLSVPSDTTPTIKRLSVPKMRQSEQRDDLPTAMPPDSLTLRHRMGSVSSKRLTKEKSETGDSDGLSSTLKNMSAKSIIDALMNFNTVSNDEQVMQWDSWLKSHGVCHPVIAELHLQAELINVLGLTFSTLSSSDVHGDTSSVIAGGKQRRLICTHMLSNLVQSHYSENPDISNEAKSTTTALVQQQAIFLAVIAKAVHPDLNKLFKYQLPKVLRDAVWPEIFDEKKLKTNLDGMGMFSILSDILVSVAKMARLTRTQPMAAMHEDVQLLLKQTLQSDLSDLVLTSIKQATVNLFKHADERGHNLQMAGYLLTQFYALLDQQLDAVKRAFGLPLKY